MIRKIIYILYTIRHKQNLGTIDDLADTYAAQIVIGFRDLLSVPYILRPLVIEKLKERGYVL